MEIRLQKSQANLEKIQQIMGTWADAPLFKRGEQKSTLLEMEGREARVTSRNKEIAEAGQRITELVGENKQLLRLADEASGEWRSYAAYVDQMVFDGFNKIVACSLGYFLRETDFVRFVYLNL